MEQFSQSELAKHHDAGDLWVSIRGKVYNISGYVDDHPGGVEVLKDVAGSDGTESFEYVGHSEDAYKTLQRYQIGVLEDHPINEGSDGLAKAWDAHRPKFNNDSTVSRPRQKISAATAFTVAVALMSRWFLSNQGSSEGAHVEVAIKPHMASSAVIPPFWVGMLVAASLSLGGCLCLYATFTRTLEYYKEVWEYPSYFSCKANRTNI